MPTTLIEVLEQLLAGTLTNHQANELLEQHRHLQQQVDVAVAEVPYNRALCVLGALRKLKEQDDRWGKRRYPSFDASLVSSADTGPLVLAQYHELPDPVRARLTTDARGDELAWVDLLVEEVAKTTERYEDPQALRAQLLDVAAVALQWAEQLTEELTTPDHEGPGEQP